MTLVKMTHQKIFSKILGDIGEIFLRITLIVPMRLFNLIRYLQVKAIEKIFFGAPITVKWKTAPFHISPSLIKNSPVVEL